jgi:hypothetical protein
MAHVYPVGAKVTLTAARGGWTGFIFAQVGGPQPLYQIQSPNGGDPTEATQVVAESDIAAGPLTAPVFVVGQQVTLAGAGGEVAGDNADGTYQVRIAVPRDHYTITRVHTVPTWRLAVENGG